MAWYSVHESIYGPKLREMYHRLCCSEFEAVGILNALWCWGLSNAEKDGFLPYAGEDEIERYLYSKSAGSVLDPKKIVEVLISTGWLDKTDRGIFIHDWDIWQEQWYKAREKREYNTRKKREYRMGEGERSPSPAPEEDEPQEDQPACPQNGTAPDKGDAAPQPEKPKYSKDFEEFWAAYPRKIGKGEAYKKYKARRNDGFSEAELLVAAQNYALQCRKQRTNQQYIKHAKTFLSENTPFVDYIPKDMKPTEKVEPDLSNPFAEYGEDS